MGRFLELARGRRSIRRYTEEAIDEERLARILEAAHLAPSGNNSQPWRFIIVRDQGVKEQLWAVAGKQSWIVEAPVTIAVVADIAAKLPPHSVGEPHSADDPKLQGVLLKTVRDATIAADHLVMAAEDEGLGSCWIALFEQDEIRPVLGVPASCFVTALITLGVPAEKPEASDRHSLRELVFENRYGLRPEGAWLDCEE